MTSNEIKKDALLRTKGKYLNLIIINVIYYLILAAFTFAVTQLAGENNASILKIILSIFIIAITFPFSYGVLASTIKISRGEDVSSTEFINIGIKNIGKIWKLTFRIFFKLLVPFIILTFLFMAFIFFLLSTSHIVHDITILILTSAFFVLFLLVYIYIISRALSYVFANTLLHDNPDCTNIEIIKKSETLMHKNKLKYMGLVLSFIGWFLLIILICIPIKNFVSIELAEIVEFVLTTILTPYISVSQIVFYEDKLNNVEVK